jgi:hypothetical protein
MLRLEVRRQFGQLQFRLAPVGAASREAPWSPPCPTRSALVAALKEALVAVDFGGGQSVIFREHAYLTAEALTRTVAFTGNL